MAHTLDPEPAVGTDNGTGPAISHPRDRGERFADAAADQAMSRSPPVQRVSAETRQATGARHRHGQKCDDGRHQPVGGDLPVRWVAEAAAPGRQDGLLLQRLHDRKSDARAAVLQQFWSGADKTQSAGRVPVPKDLRFIWLGGGPSESAVADLKEWKEDAEGSRAPSRLPRRRIPHTPVTEFAAPPDGAKPLISAYVPVTAGAM
ncbi:hypothetical protein [Streptomyces albidoflavus]|uniref:hypothetical protein n=1 Tax=Streptomyces albidoflavus TaxID=1886 RepID=UPI0033E4469F